VKYLALFAVFLFVSACPKPVPPPVNPTPDAADAASPIASCGAACANESGLGCPGASGCAALCPRLLRNHADYAVCVTRATSCDAIGACDTAAAGAGKSNGPGSGRSGP
jgi:hypothetical protein